MKFMEVQLQSCDVGSREAEVIDASFQKYEFSGITCQIIRPLSTTFL